MMEWRLLVDREVVYERAIQAWDVTLDYVKARPRAAYLCLGAAATGIFVWKYGQDIRHRYFAWISYKFTGMKQEEYDAFKNTVFAHLSDVKSHDEKLQKKNAIRILEIGAGVGANFSKLPENSLLTVVDPNPYFEEYFRENKDKFPYVTAESIIVAKGEDIDMLECNSFDVVVTTLVLCSVTDVAKVVSQIKRVLVPGGKYLFVEHVKEWNGKKYSIRRFLQTILTKTGLWPFVFDGCCLDRNPYTVIEAVGFSSVSAEHDYAPMPAFFMKLASPHLKGVAIK